MTYITYWERKGIKEGKQEGMREGMREGKQEGRRELLEILLREKFGQLPSWVVEKLEKADASTVDAWCRTLLQANSLEAVFAA